MINPAATQTSKKTGIAFYAPLKSPSHPIPSGDRKIAQQFFKALSMTGFEVELASNLRTFDKQGDAQRQQRLQEIAKKEARRILRRWARINFCPKVWFSYHLYYKAPDLIGPIICRELGIAYVVAEASWAEKRATGNWSFYHSQVNNALQMADKVICINPIDRIALTQYFQHRAINPIVSLNAFIDENHYVQQFQNASPQIRLDERTAIAKQYNFDVNKPWLLTIAMMRSGDKFTSYQLLSKVINRLKTEHQLLIIGDGQMRPQTNELFNDQSQCSFAGALNEEDIQKLLPHFEILIWPAINEALGMIFLEAQQAGVTVIAGDQGGVSSVIRQGVGGYIFSPTDTSPMAFTVDHLLNSPDVLTAIQANAKAYITHHHSLTASSQILGDIIEQTISSHAS